MLALREDKQISAADLTLAPGRSAADAAPQTSVAGSPRPGSAGAILEALKWTPYNKTAGGRVVGVTFRHLRDRLERLGIH